MPKKYNQKICILLICFKIFQKVLCQTSTTDDSSVQLCRPERCAFLCCNSDNTCSTLSSNCVNSLCLADLCVNNCCHKGRCGTSSECQQPEIIAAMVLSILMGLCACICVIVCACAIFDRCRKSRRIQQNNNPQENIVVDQQPEILDIDQVHREGLQIKNKVRIPIQQVAYDTNNKKFLKNLLEESNNEQEDLSGRLTTNFQQLIKNTVQGISLENEQDNLQFFQNIQLKKINRNNQEDFEISQDQQNQQQEQEQQENIELPNSQELQEMCTGTEEYSAEGQNQVGKMIQEEQKTMEERYKNEFQSHTETSRSEIYVIEGDNLQQTDQDNNQPQSSQDYFISERFKKSSKIINNIQRDNSKNKSKSIIRGQGGNKFQLQNDISISQPNQKHEFQKMQNQLQIQAESSNNNNRIFQQNASQDSDKNYEDSQYDYTHEQSMKKQTIKEQEVQLLQQIKQQSQKLQVTSKNAQNKNNVEVEDIQDMPQDIQPDYEQQQQLSSQKNQGKSNTKVLNFSQQDDKQLSFSHQ